MGNFDSSEIKAGYITFEIDSGYWGVEYTYHPFVDKTLYALVKHDNEEDIVDFFGNFFCGWESLEDTKQTAIHFIEEHIGEKLDILSIEINSINS